MSETLEELKAIDRNQPKDGTAQIYGGEYWKQTKNLVFYVWSNVTGEYKLVPDAPKDLYNLRSLSDIKRIIELMELIKDINENEDLDDCRYLAAIKALKQ